MLQIFFIILVQSFALGDYYKTDCIGPMTAKKSFVYLHGWDDPNMGSHEKENRRQFQKWAKKKGWRIALPRGKSRCSKGRRQCWNTRTKDSVLRAWNRIQEASLKCKLTADWGVVGFSNGGYLVSSLFTLCPANMPNWLMQFGAGENSRVGSIQKKDCTPFAIAIGKRDISFAKAKAYAARLKALGSPVLYHEFHGGHVIDFALLSRLIDKKFIH